jgi:hypothetical protein
MSKRGKWFHVFIELFLPHRTHPRTFLSLSSQESRKSCAFRITRPKDTTFFTRPDSIFDSAYQHRLVGERERQINNEHFFTRRPSFARAAKLSIDFFPMKPCQATILTYSKCGALLELTFNTKLSDFNTEGPQERLIFPKIRNNSRF